MPAMRSLESKIDDLFRQPLSEFIAARNALARRLKSEQLPVDAEQVRALAKPTTPAWAVNQLFWEEPKAFDRLFALTERVRKAQTGQTKKADLPALLDEKKAMMSSLMTRATAILAASPHAATPEVLRRITATLESIAISARTRGAPQPGRLTSDLEPPGFEALTAFMGAGKMNGSAKVLLFRAPPPREDPSVQRARDREAVQAAEKTLRDARQAAQRAGAAATKANARAAAVEKQRQRIEARYLEAKAEASAASNEARKAAQAVADAERALARARAEVE